MALLLTSVAILTAGHTVDTTARQADILEERRRMNNGLSSNASPTRHTRRLSDHVLIAFHHACDQGNIEAARRLLDVLEFMVRRPRPSPDGRERRAKESLVAAHERLWLIQHQGASADSVKGANPPQDVGHAGRS
jgi:hypothetical protein